MAMLACGSDIVELPDDLSWPDEFTWQPVAQKTTYGVTGSLMIESASKRAGRTIKLQGGDSFAWIGRAELAALRALAAIPGAQMTLTLRGEDFNVIFDQVAGAIDAAPVADFSDPDDADAYVVTLRFLVL